MSFNKTGIFLFALLMSSFFSCKKDKANNIPSAPATPGTNEVWMQNTAFVPPSITVAVNTVIKWTNKDNMDHNVTSNTGLFSSGTIGSAGTFTHQFTAAGLYPYNCTIHSGMNGTVTVQ